MYKEESELDLRHYLDLAKAQVGQTHFLHFQSYGKWREKAGKFTILAFEEDDRSNAILARCERYGPCEKQLAEPGKKTYRERFAIRAFCQTN